MRQMVDKIMNQYGTDLVLTCNGVEKTARGFFRAVNSKAMQSMEAVATPLGELSRGQYTYIGPADMTISEGDTVTVGEKSYRFRRVEPYYYGNQIIYLWGLCIEKGGSEIWGAQS